MNTPRRPFRLESINPNKILGVAFAVTVIVSALLSWPVNAFEIVGQAASTLALERNQGRLVRLPEAADTVFVANPDIADVQVKSPQLIYLFAKEPGETTLFAVNNRQEVLANIDVTVTHNLDELRQAIRDLDETLDISVGMVAGSIILDGVVSSPRAVEDIRRLAAQVAGSDKKVINRVGVTAPSQVNLRVRVVEVARDVEKQLGIDWTTVGKVGEFAFGFGVVDAFAGNALHGAAMSAVRGSWSLDVLIDALENEGLVQVMAEPNLTALSGETASFLAGGEFPMIFPTGEDNVYAIEYKKFGVSLAFTPTLLDGNRINLHVNPEVSSLSTTNSITIDNIKMPALVTRRAETTVELASGQSFAIAGLMQSNVTHDISKFPGLGDIPVLGTLFRSDRFQREESELVIIVTPYVVKPTQTADLATPVDGFAPPNDYQRLTQGGTYRRALQAGTPKTVTRDGTTLIGPVGFQAE